MQSKTKDREPYFDSKGNRVHGVYTRANASGERVFVIGYRATDGRQVWQTVPGGVTAARAALADVQARKGRGERVAPAPRLTFAQAAEAWFDSQAASLRPSTQSGYRTHLDTHLLPEFGRDRMDSITVDDVARFVAKMRTASYRTEVERRTAANRGERADKSAATAGYKAWTIRGVLTVAGRVFEHAQRRQNWNGQNPVRLLERGERPRSDQAERRVLTADELGRLLGAADERYRPIFAFAAGTGCRLGEVLGLKWREIDLDHGTASITHQVDRKGNYVELKTARSRRTVELPTELVTMLSAQKLAAPAAQSTPDAYVFSTRTGTPHEHRNVAGRALARAIKRAGLDADPERLPTMHSLRHSFASAWIASGGDVVELSSHLGHRDPSVTMGIYSHEFDKMARSDARRARLDSLFGSSLVAADRSEPQQSAAAASGNVQRLRA